MNEVPQGYPHDDPTSVPQPLSGHPHPQEYGMAAQVPPRRRTRRGWWMAGGAVFTLAVIVGLAVVAVPAFAAAGPQNPILGFFTEGKTGGHPGRDGGHHMRPGGLTVQKVSGDTITATRPDGQSVTIHTSSSTTYWREDSQVDAGAVTSGAHIAVRGQRASDGSVTATRIDIVMPSYAGMVTAITGSDLTIKGRDGQTHTIHTGASTKVKRAGEDVTFAAIAVGDKVLASGTLNGDQTLTADVVRIMLPHAGGQVTAINGADITVRNHLGSTITIHTSGSTKFYAVSRGQNGTQKTPIALGDLKTGDLIIAEGTHNSDGSINAQVVAIVPQGALHGHDQPGQPGQPGQSEPAA